MQITQTGIEDMKVLVVEDSVESMNLIKTMLLEFGITQIYTAKSGKAALGLLGTFDGEDFTDVVLCDWNMPRMSGMDVLRGRFERGLHT